jgi:hypothetical protein
LIGGWHIVLKKDTQGRCDCRFVIVGLDLPVLTHHAPLEMLYQKPRRDPKENWKNHGKPSICLRNAPLKQGMARW